MSRVGSGDKEQKVENENDNKHRLAQEAVESLTGAGMGAIFFENENPDPFLDVKDSTNVGRGESKSVKLSHGDL